MDKFKTSVLAAAGLAVGFLTVRRLRRRRVGPREEAESAVGEALDETEQAVAHATAAAGHARVAGGKALEYAREELETPVVDDEETPLSTPTRIRKVGTGWVRR